MAARKPLTAAPLCEENGKMLSSPGKVDYLFAPRSPPDPSCCGVLEPHFEMHFGVHFGDFNSLLGSFWGPFCSLFGGLSMRWMTFHVLELSGLLFPLPFGTSLGLFWVSFF